MQRQSTSSVGAAAERWPLLPYEAWKETHDTLHMWTQIVGKVKMELSPKVNHWWHVPLYVATRGLTTSAIPYRGGLFEVSFDLIDHNLFIFTSEGTAKAMPLFSRSVADFYREFMQALHALNIDVAIKAVPDEVANPIPFDKDVEHAAYDAEYANRFWRILMQTDTVLNRYRSPFLGKSSPIQLFWGGFDLSLSLFSGRRAPERQGVDHVMQESISHEEVSCGFWAGNASFPAPAFYSYTSPEPSELKTASIRPAAAFYSQDLGEFVLRYDDVRTAQAPEQALLEFYQSTYAAGATLGQWDREALERQ